MLLHTETSPTSLWLRMGRACPLAWQNPTASFVRFGPWFAQITKSTSSSLWKERLLWKKKKNEETSLRAFFSVSSCELRINCGRRCVSICVSSVRLTNVCYTCTDVSSIPHIVFLESMYILKRIMFFFFFCESPLSLCASSLFVACSSQPRF